MIDPYDTMKNAHARVAEGLFHIGDLVLSRYEVLAKLGQGGMGVVYKCLDKTSDIEVALKALPPELSHNTIEMKDIKENFQLVTALSHKNIASIKQLEREPESGNYYLIMEYCPGEDLYSWFKKKSREGRLTPAIILPIIRQIADALDYAHNDCRLIHRDIKPANVMIDAAGKVKILDFGLAAQIHTSMSRVSMAYHGTSGTGPYMAPEQWRGKKQNAAADQYALAVMTYQLLSGDLPFESPDPAVLQQAVLTQTADEIPNIPKYMNKAIQRAMSKNPDERFDCCVDFADALGGKKIKGAKNTGGGAFWKVAAFFLLLVLLAGGGYFYYDKLQKEQAVSIPAATENEQQSPNPKPQRKAEKIQPPAAKKQRPATAKSHEDERVRTGFIQATYRLQVRVMNKKENVEALSCDPGQTFGKHLDSLKENFSAGILAMKNKDIRSANVSFKNAEDAADWIIKNIPLRRQVQQLQKQIAAQKTKADRFNGSRLAFVAYRDAENMVASAARDYESGNFSSAENALRSAISCYEKAFTEARDLTVSNFISSARFAGSRKDWARMLKQAEAALKIDSNSTEAQKLKAEAKKHLPQTTLDIIATVDGVRVPAKVKFGTKILDTMSTLEGFTNGQTYNPVLTYKSGSAEYTGELKIVCDWFGMKKMTVALEKVIFSLPKGIKLEMLKLEPGTFTMSKKDGENWDDEVEHSKTLTKPFYIGVYEVTNAQWCAVMNVSEAPSAKNKGDKYPVELISWYEAMKFCEKMNQYAPKGWSFMLPTETQWEFAARGGKRSKGHKYSGSNNLADVSWYKENSGGSTHPFGEKKPNECGLYDMSGNVWEWCLDNWQDKSNNTLAEFVRAYSDTDSSKRVFRGGSWSGLAKDSRSSTRFNNVPDTRFNNLGLRLVLIPVAAVEKPKTEEERKPMLEIIATVDGARVPAKVKFGTKILDTMSPIQGFTNGQTYNPVMTYKSGDVEYTGELEFVCNWSGMKKMTVTLVDQAFSKINCNGVPLEMVKIKAGTFTMGSPFGEAGRESDEEAHQVTLTRDYWLGKYEVTQAQWEAVMGNNPSGFKSQNRPVEQISWHEARDFCKKLNEKYSGKLPSGYKFDLPTEAQWEYACRAGTTTSLNSGENMQIAGKNNSGNLDKVGWYGGNCGQNFELADGCNIASWEDKQYSDNIGGTHPVGQKRPNHWGLYDMHGNVWEWCSDLYGAYDKGAATDPIKLTGTERVRRGGSWSNYTSGCRSAYRHSFKPDKRENTIGFRLALVPIVAVEKPKKEEEKAPTLDIIATVDGARVPAKVKFGTKILDTMSTLKGFTKGQTYNPVLTYKSGAAEYTGELKIVCDWSGLKKMTVALEKVVFNGIVEYNGMRLEMVKIKAGTFMMGSPSSESGRSNDEKQHSVTLTKDYWLGKYEVTQAQWQAVMGNNPSHFKGDNRPVEKVSWNEAKQFCDKLNERYAGKLPRGYKFDLPTEAQWEYACRAGTTTALNSGEDMRIIGKNNSPNLDLVGWYAGNCGRDFELSNGHDISGWSEKQYSDTRGGTHPVGRKQPNNWGLYDMHGNVWEWCRDWYGSYSDGAVTDPAGPQNGSSRVLRGGGWSHGAEGCRSACRYYWRPGNRYSVLGFRLALVPVQ